MPNLYRKEHTMNLLKYDECQMRLGAISDDFYLDAMAVINNLEGNEHIVAEQLVKSLTDSLAEICLIISHSLRG